MSKNRTVDPEFIDHDELPGHYVRRMQQIAVAIFLEETESLGVTPVQFGAMQTVANQPGIDQRTLARSIGLDTSTIASVLDRLEARGLLVRSLSAQDRRLRCLTLSREGVSLLAAVVPAMRRAQERMLEPLTKVERKLFMSMLKRVVEANNELSRAPRES